MQLSLLFALSVAGRRCAPAYLMDRYRKTRCIFGWRAISQRLVQWLARISAKLQDRAEMPDRSRQSQPGNVEMAARVVLTLASVAI